MSTDTRLSPAGAEIAEALNVFLDAVEQGGASTERFTVRMVSIRIGGSSRSKLVDRPVIPMLDGPLVFVDVDTQRDFLDPNGALFIAGSGAIRPTLARLTAFACERGIPVIATACAHAPEDREEDFPPHCVRGTAGQGKVEETATPGSVIVEPGSGLVPDAIPPHLTIHKGAYDVFSTPEAGPIVARYARDNPTFVVYGVATDYCVRCVVDGLVERGHNVALVVDAIRGVDATREAAELTRFAQAGTLLTVADVVCGNGHP